MCLVYDKSISATPLLEQWPAASYRNEQPERIAEIAITSSKKVNWILSNFSDGQFIGNNTTSIRGNQPQKNLTSKLLSFLISLCCRERYRSQTPANYSSNWDSGIKVETKGEIQNFDFS